MSSKVDNAKEQLSFALERLEAAAEKKVSGALERVSGINVKKENLKKELEEYKKLLSEKDELIDALEKKADSEEKRASEAIETLGQEREKNIKLEASLKNEIDKTNSLQGEIAEISKGSGDIKESYQSALREAEKAEKTNSELSINLEKLRSELQSAEDKIKKSAADYDDALKLIEESEKALALKDKQLAEAEKSFSIQIIELKSLLEDREGAVSHLKSENNDLRIQVGRDQDRIRRLESANHKAAERVDNLIKELQATADKVAGSNVEA